MFYAYQVIAIDKCLPLAIFTNSSEYQTEKIKKIRKNHRTFRELEH